MSRAKKFIQDCTINCSNLVYKDTINGKEFNTYNEWLTPDQARRAVDIAREEIIEKVCAFLGNDLCCYIKAQDFTIEHQRLENDLKLAMKYE